MRDERLHVDYGVWGTINRVAWTLLILCVSGAIFVFWYAPAIRQSKALQREIEIKREALKQQEALKLKYDEELKALRSDPEAVERAVRERLKLVKPNETIYRVESPKTSGH